MPTLTVEPELLKRVEKAAVEQKASADAVVVEAVRAYLWELDRRKISEESKFFIQQHPQLRAQYSGQYIAMQNGEVVDRDTELGLLRVRVRDRFRETPVLITLVEDTAEPMLARNGFRLAGEE